MRAVAGGICKTTVASTHLVSPRQPPAYHCHPHVLPAGDLLQEGLRLHPVQAGAELGGQDHVQEEAPRAHHLQVWHQQLGRSGDLCRGEVPSCQTFLLSSCQNSPSFLMEGDSQMWRRFLMVLRGHSDKYFTLNCVLLSSLYPDI